MRGAGAPREAVPATRAARPTTKLTTKRAAVRIRAHAPSARLVDRRRKFIEAAERLFLERGFAGTSVNEVVRVAGGSLATLYAEFGTKEALFEAVLSRRAAAIFEGNWQDPAHIADVRAELRALATRMQARILSPDGLAIYRLAVSEAPRFPSLRKAFVKTGLGGFLNHLAGYFEQLAGARRIVIADPLLAAEHFLTLAQGQQLFIASCGGASRLSAAQRKLHIERVVEAFLRIYPLAGARHRV
jgi:AcrR family transcriptional regulator